MGDVNQFTHEVARHRVSRAGAIQTNQRLASADLQGKKPVIRQVVGRRGNGRSHQSAFVKENTQFRVFGFGAAQRIFSSASRPVAVLEIGM